MQRDTHVPVRTYETTIPSVTLDKGGFPRGCSEWSYFSAQGQCAREPLYPWKMPNVSRWNAHCPQTNTQYSNEDTPVDSAGDCEKLRRRASAVVDSSSAVLMASACDSCAQVRKSHRARRSRRLSLREWMRTEIYTYDVYNFQHRKQHTCIHESAQILLHIHSHMVTEFA